MNNVENENKKGYEANFVLCEGHKGETVWVPITKERQRLIEVAEKGIKAYRDNKQNTINNPKKFKKGTDGKKTNK